MNYVAFSPYRAIARFPGVATTCRVFLASATWLFYRCRGRQISTRTFFLHVTYATFRSIVRAAF